MPEAITAACFGMATIGIFSLFLPGKVRYVDSTGWSHANGGGGCAALLFGPGALFATVGIVLKELSPDYYLAFAAMLGSFVALILPLMIVADFEGVGVLPELCRKVVAGESSPGVLVGRSGPRAILRKLMSVEQPVKATGYRDGDGWGVFESQLSAVAKRESRLYTAVLAASAMCSLFAVPAALYQLFIIREFEQVATRVFVVLLGATLLDLGVCFLTRRQLRRAAEVLPAAVAAARRAHPKPSATRA